MPECWCICRFAAQLSKSVTAADLTDILAEYYDGEALVRMGSPQAGDPETAALMLDAAALAGQNHVELFVFANADNSQFWLTARLISWQGRVRCGGAEYEYCAGA